MSDIRSITNRSCGNPATWTHSQTQPYYTQHHSSSAKHDTGTNGHYGQAPQQEVVRCEGTYEMVVKSVS